MNWIKSICLMVVMGLASAMRAAEPYIDETFATWPAVHYVGEGIHHQNNWRFFSVAGAAGSLVRIPTAEGAYIRITRSTAAGDSGLDLDQPDQTIILPPQSALQLRVWARRKSATATMELKLAEYQGTQFLGIDHPHTYSLGDDFAPYGFSVVTGAQTTRVNVAVRVLTGETLEVDKIELLPSESATGTVPRILLPQGWTPNEEPILYWRGSGHAASQFQLASSLQFTTTTWDSGTVISGSDALTLPSQTPNDRVFARVRVQGFDGVWSAWSDPTLIHYAPLPQLPSGSELYVYDAGTIYTMNDEENYEQSLLISSLQGLVNRESPRLIVLGAAYVQEWLDKLIQPGRWLENTTITKGAGARATYQLVSTGEGAALRMTRNNLVGDTGVDKGLPELALPVTSETTIRVTCRARAMSAGAQLLVYVPEHDVDFDWLGINNARTFTPTSSFQDYTYTFTVGTHTSLINPSLRVGTVGSVEVKSFLLYDEGASNALMAEDFEGWSGTKWVTPTTWSNANGWRIFGTSAPDIVELVNRFSGAYEGVVLWDPAVPATSNVAATIAGVEDLLPIPLRDVEGSLYRKLVTGGPQLPVKRSLVGMFTGAGLIPGTSEASSGSAKNDAYRWAIRNYVETGLCDPGRLLCCVDAFGGKYHSNLNIDFFVMHRGFMWDLSVWDDETPIDDRTQPLGTDVTTLKRLLLSAVQRSTDTMVQCGGFIPITLKYTNYVDAVSNAGGTHPPVATEWKLVETLSAYNVELEADAVIPNCSVFTHMPRPVRLNQMPPPLREECVAAGWLDAQGNVASRAFIMNYVGDYDSPAWLNTILPPFWDNGLRGRIMLPWAWNPNLSERGMAQFDEYMRTRTPKDPLWCGDSGAGYINPNQLFSPRTPSGLPDASVIWQKHCAKWFRMFDLRTTGFIINGNKEPSTDAARVIYESFSGDGIVDGWTTEQKMIGTMPVVKMKHIELPLETTQAAAQAAAQATSGEPSFVPLRSILRSPDYYYQLNRTLQVDYSSLNPAFVAPLEFFYLLRQRLGGLNHYRAAFLGDTFDSGTLTTAETVRGSVWLRNLGWQTWPSTGANAIRVGVELTTTDQRNQPLMLDLPAAVAPGGMVQIDFDYALPVQPGLYYWRIDLREGASTWFGERGNLPESRSVQLIEPASGSRYWSAFN